MAVIFNPGSAVAARRRIKAFRATVDRWTSACVRSVASRIRGFMQRREAGLIQQHPGRLDARQPCIDGWILQHVGSYHRATLM